MTNAKTLLGYPINFQGLFDIYPPKIKDMVAEDNFNLYQKVLTLSAEEIYDSQTDDPIDAKPQFTVSLEVNANIAPKPLKKQEISIQSINPLEYLLINCYKSNEFLQYTIEAFKFFTHLDILPLYELKAIYVGDLTQIGSFKSKEELPLLDEHNFFEFQNTIRSVVGIQQIEKPDPNEDPRITRMKAKARYRDKIKARNGQGLNFDSILVAICCMGIGITPLNIGELSYASVLQLFSMCQNKEKYELDTSCLLAGADSKKIKPKYWITNLNE